MIAEIKTIKKVIDINASKEKVWEVLLQDNFTRQWFAVFMEGTHAITDWQLDSKAIFMDGNGGGLVGTIVVNRPYEVISIEYTGIMVAGQEDYTSEEAKAVKGWRETYRLSEHEGHIRLSVTCDMSEDYFEMMSVAWDKAVVKIKELAEK